MTDFREIFLNVQKPGRYIGGEINSVKKPFLEDTVKIALAYPDMYEIGMSYLGLKIVYHLVNEMDEALCERVFMPGRDMAEELAKRNMKLFSLESRRALSEFDIVGFSLAYELTYTNVLSMLDMGGIEVRSENRAEDAPLVIAGGTCSYNPEPMSAFIDAFLIGDAEELFPKFITEYRSLRAKGAARKEILAELACLEGVYVPSLYGTGDNAPGDLTPRPVHPGVPEVIRPARVKDLETAFYPVKQIVPSVKIVHDRIAAEIMRGCPNRCRFCQAGAVNRPVRIRSHKRIREICSETYRATGLESIALLSLSSVNYPYLADVVRGLNSDLEGKGVGISIPSLRVDEKFYELPEVISVIRKAGLTFAPESANAEVMKAIGKDMDPEVLARAARLAFEKGWRSVKLYFMVGFPVDVEDEEKDIADLARRVSSLRGSRPRDAAEVRVSVNPFIPKPHTDFQRHGMKSRAQLIEKKRKMLSFSGKKIKISFHDVNQSILEGALTRGDRGVSEVIFTAWKKGAVMDGWSEFFNYGVWEEAFKSEGRDIEQLSGRCFEPDAGLPWGHIDCGFHSASSDNVSAHEDR